jgi:hypothetical protein
MKSIKSNYAKCQDVKRNNQLTLLHLWFYCSYVFLLVFTLSAKVYSYALNNVMSMSMLWVALWSIYICSLLFFFLLENYLLNATEQKYPCHYCCCISRCNSILILPFLIDKAREKCVIFASRKSLSKILVLFCYSFVLTIHSNSR